MTEQEFFDLARQGYNRFPLVREMPGDLETPLSVYLKLANYHTAFGQPSSVIHARVIRSNTPLL